MNTRSSTGREAAKYNSMAIKQRKQNKPGEAIENYTEALAAAPDMAVLYSNRGIAWNQKGNTDQAIADLSKAVKLNPELAVFFYNRGIMHSKKGNYNRAIDDFTRAAERAPGFAEVYNNSVVRDVYQIIIYCYQTTHNYPSLSITQLII